MCVTFVCDYTCLNHNSLVSPKKMITNGMIIKGIYSIINQVSTWVTHCVRSRFNMYRKLNGY
jgi:hypothetical protein